MSKEEKLQILKMIEEGKISSSEGLELDLNEILQAVKDGAQGKIVEVDDEENDTKVEVYVD